MSINKSYSPAEILLVVCKNNRLDLSLGAPTKQGEKGSKGFKRHHCVNSCPEFTLCPGTCMKVAPSVPLLGSPDILEFS